MQPAGQPAMHGRMYGYAPHPADMHGMGPGSHPGADMAPGQVRLPSVLLFCSARTFRCCRMHACALIASFWYAPHVSRELHCLRFMRMIELDVSAMKSRTDRQ